MSNRSPHAFEASTTDRGLEGGTSNCAVVCTHELHERTAHAQDDEHDDDVLVIEERVPLIDHQVGAAQELRTRSQNDSALSAPIWPEQQAAMRGKWP